MRMRLLPAVAAVGLAALAFTVFAVFALSLSPLAASSDALVFGGFSLSAFLFGLTGASFYRFLASTLRGYGRHGLARESVYLGISYGVCGALTGCTALVPAFGATRGDFGPAIIPWLMATLLISIALLREIISVRTSSVTVMASTMALRPA